MYIQKIRKCDPFSNECLTCRLSFLSGKRVKADDTLRANDHSTPFRRLLGKNENQCGPFHQCEPLQALDQ